MKNVYLPPYESLRRRQVPDLEAKQAVEDILTASPNAKFVITCGDFNARTGTRAPTVDDITLRRYSMDVRACNRATWMLRMCELTESHILNGNEHQEIAQFTCKGGKGSSAVDYIWSQDGRHIIHYDATTLEGLTDHTALHLHLPVAVQPPLPRGSHSTCAATLAYRWDAGSTIQEQVKGIAKWREHSDTPAFRTKLL